MNLSNGIVLNRDWPSIEPWCFDTESASNRNSMRLSTINLRLAAVRRVAYEAADSGLLSPELAAGIRRVKGVRRLGIRVGNWLTAEQGKRLLEDTGPNSLRRKRNRAMLSMLIGCGLRRGELLDLNMKSIQLREEHWVIADLIGKGGHIRTVPIPLWVKKAVDAWTESAQITDGRVFRSINKAGKIWGCFRLDQRLARRKRETVHPYTISVLVVYFDNDVKGQIVDSLEGGSHASRERLDSLCTFEIQVRLFVASSTAEGDDRIRC
jgi:site-specific recombinase XerC